MEREPIEVTRQDRIYCLKASSDYHSEVCEECRFYPKCDHMTQDDMTELTIKDLEVIEQEPKWIPVSEKLPKVDEEVFISFGHGSPLEIGKYNGKQWEYLYESGADYWTEPFFKVKAWMPLPDRYKE